MSTFTVRYIIDGIERPELGDNTIVLSYDLYTKLFNSTFLVDSDVNVDEILLLMGEATIVTIIITHLTATGTSAYTVTGTLDTGAGGAVINSVVRAEPDGQKRILLTLGLSEYVVA